MSKLIVVLVSVVMLSACAVHKRIPEGCTHQGYVNDERVFVCEDGLFKLERELLK